MKNKKGFISMTLVYTFLILFMFIMLAILRTYTEKNKFLETINEQIDNDVSSNKSVRSLIISRVIDQNMPNSDTNLNYFQIANGSFGNGNGFYYMDNRRYDSDYKLSDHTDENMDAYTSRIYYFRGAEVSSGGDETNLNNFMLYAGLCFRILRTNDDGSVRLVYYGPSENNQCMTNDELLVYNDNHGTKIPAIGKAKFNTTASVSYSSSPIQEVLNTWYETNIVKKMDENVSRYFSSYVSQNAIFCSDRTSYKSKQLVPHFIDSTIYNMYDDKNITNNLTLNCNSSDAYSALAANASNKLVYPVGILTAEDVALAGGYLTDSSDIYKGGAGGISNNDFYLYFEFDYWTMSPYDSSHVIYVTGLEATGNKPVGGMIAGSPTEEHYVIPVFSLSPGLSIKTGTGSYMNPFRVF